MSTFHNTIFNRGSQNFTRIISAYELDQHSSSIAAPTISREQKDAVPDPSPIVYNSASESENLLLSPDSMVSLRAQSGSRANRKTHWSR